MGCRCDNTAIHSGLQIHTCDLRTIEQNFHRRCTSDLYETRELKGDEAKKLHTTSRSLTTYHPQNHLTRRYDCEKRVHSVSKHASIPPGTNRAKYRTMKERMQRTMKEKQKLCGGENIQWWSAIKTRQDLDRSALRRPTASGWGQGT